MNRNGTHHGLTLYINNKYSWNLIEISLNPIKILKKLYSWNLVENNSLKQT